MKALCFKKKFEFFETETPEPRDREILIRTHAFGLNHADLLQKIGKYPPPPGASEILGLEIAGIVEKTCPNAKRYKKGDRVMALLQGGGYAQYVTVDERLALPIPETLSFEEAASIPEAFLTAYQALFIIGELQPEQNLLIHAGGSGVGTAAIQLAKEAGATVLITTRSQDKLLKCLELNADAGFNTKEKPFAKKVLEATEDHGIDLILDFIGANYFSQNLEVLAQNGAIIFLASLGGKILESVDISQLMGKWATLTATTLRARPLSYRARLVSEFEKFALERFQRGALKPCLHGAIPWKEIEEGHRLLAENKVFGKLVARVY